MKSKNKGLSSYQGVRKLCSALLMSAGLVLLTQGTVSAKTLRSADVHPNNYPTVESVNYMSEKLKEMTNGELDIKVFGSGQLGNEKATIEQTRFGVLDMNRITLGEINNLVEDTIVLSLPYVFRSKEHMRKVVDSEIGAEMLASLEPHGLIGLAFFDAGSRNIYNSKHEVKTPSDLAGLKIRVQPSDIFLDMINTLGANAVPMGFNEMYSGLQTGVIDGTEQSWPTYESTNHVEVAKYYSLTEHLMLPEALVMSKITYDKLTEEQKKAVHAAAQDAKYKMRELWDAREKESERIVKEKGAIVTEVDKQLFMDKVAPVQEKYLKNERLKALFDRIQAVE
ncbi:C4-dicarboxylate ABC transporter [Paenalcaligenes hominis]|uniref:C4-dicarboxylate ABC transporter n=1 Tax=Paenalcaligenes hominis TaxID=643674 RepID=A0A1U9K104_9BURK|nr:TRAP transporter substrate-binding protein [Paenalcaligenes hominis]AQS51698.1 C4-dicarboxylate ABC transporter [Paenalcaligenes hominis]